MNTPRPAGVILAGGRSSRMGQEHKALLQLNGRSMLARVIDRLQPQVEPLMLSCAAETAPLEIFRLPLVPDLLPGFQGPLTGLYSALQYLADTGQHNGLIVCPCDAPFIPVKLVEVLLDAVQDEIDQGKEIPVVVISSGGILQPTFSLWHNHHLPAIHAAIVNRGSGGLKQVLTALPHKVVEWVVVEPSPFFNVNTPQDLETAAVWLDRMHT